MTVPMYRSTRGSENQVSSTEAIVRGIAEDGGLYVPAEWPGVIEDLHTLKEETYQKIAFRVMAPFLGDFTDGELKACIEKAYDKKFDTTETVVLTKAAGVHFLELYHGPTLAFKDMALTILPHLMMVSAKKLNLDQEIVILTATSGDTGKAALEGFAGVPGTRIIVFYPASGVSQIQKRQMVTQTGHNTHVIGIEGNFDDAQNGVKAIFGDGKLKKRMKAAHKMFSSANSINIGRLVPQVVYYFYAYARLMKKGEITPGQEINFVVPTGNFGNILAGYYAKMMGLPVNKLICASNDNKVLFDFFRRGTYDKKRDFYTTISPSMDILISSNLERLLFLLTGEDGDLTRDFMDRLNKKGEYSITPQMKEKLADFYGGFATEEQTRKTIKQVFSSAGYLIDTHTAVAYSVYQDYLQETGDNTPTVVLSTASPYKFTRDVLTSLDEKYAGRDEFELIKEMSALLKADIPGPLAGLENRPVLHKSICTKDEMQKEVEKRLGL